MNVKKLVFGIGMNLFWVYVIWGAVLTGEQWMTNFTYAWCVFATFMSFVIMVLPTDATEKLAKKSTIPTWYSHLCDALMLIPLIAYGWWWCAAAQAFQWAACAYMLGIRDKKEVTNEMG